MSNDLKDNVRENITRRLIGIGKILYEKDLVSASSGNISARYADGFLITVTGSSLGFLKPDDITYVTLDGKFEEGKKPSCEFGMHAEIYKRRSDINAVIHTHPAASAAFAVRGKELPVKLLPEAFKALGEIKVAEFAHAGTKELALNVAAFAKDFNGCLLDSHGLITWGADFKTAFAHTETADYVAKVGICLREI